MGKHSKNAGGMGSEALTYHERRALGWTTEGKERLGKVGVAFQNQSSLVPREVAPPPRRCFSSLYNPAPALLHWFL
jgi:hypothetical protein